MFESQYMMGVAQTPFNFLKIYFEVVSAFATVGLSMGFS
jgi:Trk-type K+ transport system membrane component